MRKRALLACSLLFCLSAFSGQKNKHIVLENKHIAVVFDAESGALMRMTDKNSGWEIMRREVLGQSFEVLMPLEGPQMTDADCRFNVIKGIKQSNPIIQQDDNRITFTWRGMKSEHMDKEADITFKGVVSLTGKGLEFSGSLVNKSEYPIEYVSWPCIGEITVPDKTQPLHHSTRSDVRELFPHFFNQHGYWGVDYPTSTYVLPEKFFLQVNDRERGFMAYTRQLPKYMLITSFELIPGFEVRGENPYTDEMDGEMVRIQFKANHVVYNRPGESSMLDPLEFVTYKGGWTKGVDIYKNDRVKQASKAKRKTPEWLASPLTWRKASISSGVDLLRYAEESAKLGVDVLLVNGWFRGVDGHIVEVPGLEEAIAKCHKLGLRVVLETNWTSVDRHAKGYNENLRKYVMTDPFNMPYNYNNMCPNAPAIQDWIKKEWLKLPALHAADGYMNNDHNHNNKTFMCFDRNHNHRFGEPTINGMMKIDSEMTEALAANGDKVAMGRGFIEYQNDIYDGCQVSVNDDFYARHRFMNPATPMVSRVEVRNARREMNKALLNRMNIVYDLNFFSNRLSDYPHITEYGRQIKALRNRYSDYIWTATFDECNGATVNGAYVEYAVFIARNGKRAVIVTNISNDWDSKVSVALDNSTSLVYATPESLKSQTFNGTVELAPLSVAIIMEK
ncbi:DUF6259 domain-containing protein [Bacteroides sp.]|uniref:DUF6259 domain-containing protein n=1 Tax=Bacteroides sp. TaxID=29523 RepID=UPI00261C9166|nr:DUF6259 domain-containing protein [Bacteroides sp.]